MKKRFLCTVLALALVLGSLGGLTAQAAERNLALNRPATASSVANGCGPEIAVDGVKDQSSQWNSENMKNGTVADDAPQNEQWLQVDLGTSGAQISQIKLWYNMKVWPMVYRIETTDTPEAADSWITVVSVSRPSRNGFVWNGDGQNIADETANTDTISTTSSPKLEKTELGRYVRFYVEKVNAQAPGNNVNLREIEIFGTLPEGGGEEPRYTVRGSELERVIANDGTPSRWNIGERDVTLLVNENGVDKNIVVTAEDQSENYPAEWFPAVSDPNPKPQVIPTVQEWYGYEGDFVLTADSSIVINDEAGVGLEKAAAILQENLKAITGLTLPITEGTEGDIYIESLTDTELYDLGDEGYLMVTDDTGIRIYAPTYTGCVFGTVTVEQILWMAEDHRCVPMGIMRDYPAYEVRGLKLDIARTPYRYQQLQDYAKIMRWYKMNEYDLHINDNDNANIQGATWESHSGFHRLESETFPSLYSETKHVGFPSSALNADYYNNNEDYQGNPVYTKEQWRALAQLTEDLGMYMITEIDLPAHSLLYNKYAMENPDNIDWLSGGIHYTGNELSTAGGIELMDLTGANKDRALRFGKALWEEYTSGDEPTIYGDIVHIGADEYWVHNTATHNGFATFANEMRKVIQKNLGEDTKIRMWGAGASSFSTAQTVLNMTTEELAANFQLDIWHTSYDNPAQRAKEGYGIVNCRDAYLYGNPGRTNRDVPNAEYLFNDWNPTIFGSNTNPLLGEPNLLGAKAVIWGDQSQEGMAERDVHQRVLQAIAIVSEKTWNGTEEDDTFAQWEIRFGHLAEGPGTEIAMHVESASALVLKYDFDRVSEDGKTVYDLSGNGYDAAVTGGAFENGWMIFDGESLLQTPLKTLSYPYTVSFDVKLTPENVNTAESSLFSGYDGRIQIAGRDGHLSADVNYFTRDFGYTVPTDGTEVEVTVVGTLHGTKLYVNGQLISFLSQKADGDGLTGAVTSMYSSVLLPLQKIGQDFSGALANIRVYNKAFSSEEVKDAYDGIDDGKVNVAQNTYAGSDSYRSGDAFDNGEQRTRTAAKAIDGDAFAVKADKAAQPDTATSDIYSYWRGDHADSALTVDLGERRAVSEIGIQWRYGGKGRDFDILTSMDGKTWTTAKAVRGNGDFFQTIELESPVSARYVKLQGIASNASCYMIQEFMVYETVSKDALAALLADAADLTSEAARQAVIFGQAMLDNPLATAKEVAAAEAALEEALAQPEPDVPLPFVDVPEGSFYYDPVAWAVKKEITNGMDATHFSPDMDCNRAQVVTFLWRAAGSPEPAVSTHSFADVAAGSFYEKAVLWAVEQGITNGTDATHFSPNMSCNRATVVTFLYRAFGSPAVEDVQNPFTDVPADSWYTAPVLWAVEKGITNGMGGGRFGVDGICNRAQIVTFLYRAYN
ncbi:MAG: discoidin domain-containing protein [Oscillospiraceae bacterium]|nr:discoidin domain-containing protein [Oscillospiraceae bacterium]